MKKATDRIDLLLHSVAFAPREALAGEFVATTRQAFSIAHDISAYSLVGLSRAALPFMEKNGGSIVAMTYLGAARVVPHYNVMGVAKASLEPRSAISRTTSASGRFGSTPSAPGR